MLDRRKFNIDVDVCEFSNWAAQHLTALPISLNFSSSRVVPGGLRADVMGLPNALTKYVWKSEGATDGSWFNTVALLAAFRERLHVGLESGSEAAALSACEDIIKWGGDRNSNNGALPFLRELAGRNELVRYLSDVRADLALSSASLGATRRVRKMNSMLTKIHALASDDGLPIYDSRVAAAIAALVEMWRRTVGRSNEPLPALLSFPATLRTRTVRQLDPNAISPNVMLYGKANEARTACDWSEAKIRLGWLMQRILADSPSLFIGNELERMHAFEASLFMIGYDVSCLSH